MLDDFASWLLGIIEQFVQWLLDLAVAVLEWIGEFLLWCLQKVWELLLSGLAEVFEAIPVPSFMAQASSFFGALPPTVVYFLQFFAVAEGLTFITTALLLRFIVRRIPLIG